MDARFPRAELVRRIEVIAAMSSRITVTNMDAQAFLVGTSKSLPAKSLVYCDPPYYARAENLYLDSYEKADHARLARTIQAKARRPWIVSYDSHPAILKLYSSRKRFTYSLQYSAVRAYAGREVFVFSDELAVPATSRLPYVADGLRRLRGAA